MQINPPFFELIQSTEFRARRGRLYTANGLIETPAFMPVATYGAIRLLDFDDMKRLGAQIVLGNALYQSYFLGFQR
jgi:queuine tRNA-ribosyltransferase